LVSARRDQRFHPEISMKPRIVHTDRVPPGRAKISQAVVWGDLVFVSGMVARSPDTGKTVPGGVAEQTTQVLENIKSVLEAAGTTLEYVLKTDVHLADMKEFENFNRVWESYFPTNPPARICTQAGALGPSFLVEIDAIAGLPRK
jgi:2-iminobutanoate/2-iminopropanoate deaminase